MGQMPDNMGNGVGFGDDLETENDKAQRLARGQPR
jgi:hypothetical protein